jgi:hypothetical protein
MKSRPWFQKISPLLLSILIVLLSGSCTKKEPTTAGSTHILSKDQFLADLKLRSFNFFWQLADSTTWQTPDRYPTKTFTSIAATGFALPSYLIGIENKYITREQGADRVLKTLTWLMQSPQGDANEGETGFKGFYYHFLTYNQGKRFQKVELSTIDTGLLMAGILACMSYFDGADDIETQIRTLSEALYKRVEWDWAMNGRKYMSMGWHPEKGFLASEWKGYNEAMVLIVMAMGSPTHPIADSAWNTWCKTYQWANYQSYDFVNFEPLFGHQYSHMFINFKGIQDEYMTKRGIDYFENSRRATLSNRAYCMTNPKHFADYSDSIWGLTACDGPADYFTKENLSPRADIQYKDFMGYSARGVSAFTVVDDGTIAPTAAGGSIPFAPEETINALYAMYLKYGDKLYQQYGFKDAFNLNVVNSSNGEYGWFDTDYLGIDQGPILIQLENYQSGLIWKLMQKNPYIISGLKKAGFKGSWLDNADMNENNAKQKI